jgi:hypothetical protein
MTLLLMIAPKEAILMETDILGLSDVLRNVFGKSRNDDSDDIPWGYAKYR